MSYCKSWLAWLVCLALLTPALPAQVAAGAAPGPVAPVAGPGAAPAPQVSPQGQAAAEANVQAQSEPGIPGTARRPGSGDYRADPTWILMEDPQTSRLNRFVRPYQVREVAPVDFANSGRLDALLRAGNLYLSLQDAIALTLENNLDIVIQRYGAQLADADILRARAGTLLRGVDTTINEGPTGVGSQAGAQLLGGGTQRTRGDTTGGTFGGLTIQQVGAAIPNLDPQLDFSLSWFHRTNPLTNSFITGNNFLVQETMNQQFALRQGFLTGTNVTFSFNNIGLSENSPRNEINPSTTGNMRLTVSQNLLQGFGASTNSRNIRIANNNRRIADLTFKRQVIATVSAVVRLYWDLVSLREEVENRRLALEFAERLYSDNKKQVEIGTLAPIEIVRAEAEVARSLEELTRAETNVLQQETILKDAISKIGIASPTLREARIIPTDTIRIPAREAVQPIQDLIEQALATRPEIEQTEISIRNSELTLRGNRSALLPVLSVFASATNNGLAGDINGIAPTGVIRSADPFFVGGWSSVLGQIFSRNFPDYGVGVNLSIPLRNRTAQADMIRSQLTLRQQQLQQQQQENNIRVTVRNAQIALLQARARFETATKTRFLQEQTLEAEQKKYALGASTIFFVIQAQRDLANARSSEVAALSSYANARVQLDQATGQILDRFNVSVEDALAGKVDAPPSPLPPVTTP